MNFVLLPIIVAAAVGIGVLWSNPRRALNRAFFSASVLTVAWLLAIKPALAGEPDLVRSIRLASAVGALFPWQLWWIRISVNPRRRTRAMRMRGTLSWAAVSAVLFCLCFTPSFVRVGAKPNEPVFGGMQLLYVVGVLSAYGFLFARTNREIRRLKGIERLELRTLLIGGVGACVAGVALTSLSAILDLPLQRYAPTAVLVFYGITAWAVSSHRIFDVNHLWWSAARWSIVVFLLSGWWFLCERTLAFVVPPPLNLIVGMASSVLLFLALQRTLRRVFAFAEPSNADSARRKIMLAAREIAESAELNDRLEEILREWTGTDFVQILLPEAGGGALVGKTLAFANESVALRVLQADRWATPESIERRSTDRSHEALGKFMCEHQLGALVTVAGSGAMPVELIVALGPRDNGRPFVWSDIVRLLDLAEVCEHALARAHLSRKAREAEHIASVGMMGASIAHEMRNPLVALSAAAELLEHQYDDPRFRSTFATLITHEVERIQRLSVELKKFSSTPEPTVSAIDVNQVIREAIELMSARVTKCAARVSFSPSEGQGVALADEMALRQVLLNLITNALDAVDGRSGAEVRVSVRHRDHRTIAIDVSDNGPGVSPRQKPKLFTPFSSDKTNGFGLGLAFSARVVRSLRGTISLLETTEPGATFRVTLPCPPHLSS